MVTASIPGGHYTVDSGTKMANGIQCAHTIVKYLPEEVTKKPGNKK